MREPTLTLTRRADTNQTHNRRHHNKSSEVSSITGLAEDIDVVVERSAPETEEPLGLVVKEYGLVVLSCAMAPVTCVAVNIVLVTVTHGIQQSTL